MWQNSSARLSMFQAPKGEGLEDGDEFVSNDHFTAPLYRIKVNASIESLINREYLERDKTHGKVKALLEVQEFSTHQLRNTHKS
ncbi:unnamed protein product [Brassica napus]|uniref:(rape) hypothetical protein n=1 Tax=Brassica napus TaxID=3708 RepID=A0A816R648_BRANA|nr:unnamed protein product [Brassica napus]